MLIYGILLFFLFLLLLSLFNIPLFMSSLYSKIEITLYLKDGLPSSSVEDLMKSINKKREEIEIKYQSKEEALKELVGPNIINLLDKNPLLDTCKIRLFGKIEEKDFEALEEWLKTYEEIEKISYSKKSVDVLSKIKNVLLEGFLWLGMIYVFGMLIILSIFSLIEVRSSKEKREILYLSGRTKLSLFLSYLFSSMIDGFLGSILAISSLFLSYTFFGNILGFEITFFSADITLCLLGIGVLLAFLAKIPTVFFI